MPVVGIVIGLLLLTAVAAGGALLWRRMRNGLPGLEQEEGRASETGTETPEETGTRSWQDRCRQKATETQRGGAWREETETQRGTETCEVGQRLGKTEGHTHVGEGQSGTRRISELLMTSPLPLSAAPWISLRGDDVGALLPTPGLPKDADS